MDSVFLVYAHGKLARFQRAEQVGRSHFGGPLDAQLVGRRHGPAPLHAVGLVSLEIFGLQGDVGLPVGVPLVYGFCYDGCQLSYSFEAGEPLRLLDLRPSRSSRDWPYPGFPAVLPYWPVAAAGLESCSW